MDQQRGEGSADFVSEGVRAISAIPESYCDSTRLVVGRTDMDSVQPEEAALSPRQYEEGAIHIPPVISEQ